MHTQSHHRKIQVSPLSMLFLSSALTMLGCAGTDQITNGSTASSAPVVNPVDPYEGFNRPMYDFNMGVDKYLMKPVADGYKFVTPDFMETGVTNFFSNLKGLNVVLNDMLQGKLGQSVSDLGRFTTNSTIGVLGLFDVATDLGMPQNHEDFGQTLAVWGVEQGPYLVIPFLGPTTVRDGGGGIIDRAANPSTYLLPGAGVLEGISERANAEGALNFIDEAALDPYVFTRESFLQYRQNLATDGKVDANSMDLDVDSALENVEADDAATAGQDKTK